LIGLIYLGMGCLGRDGFIVRLECVGGIIIGV